MKKSDKLSRSIGVTSTDGLVFNDVVWKHLQTESGPLEFALEFGAGAWSQTLPGLAHFHEHMVIKESVRHPDELLIDNLYSRLGIRRNASTAVDVMTVVLSAPNIAAAKTATEIIYDKLTHPLFLDERLDIERGAILAELKQRNAAPTVEIYNQYTNLLMTGDIQDYSVLGGKPEIISEISREDVAGHHEIVRKNGLSQVITVGPVKLEQLQVLIRKFIDEFPRHKHKIEVRMPRGEYGFAHSGAQEIIRLGYSSSGKLDLKGIVMVRILKRLLTSGQTSYLFDLLRNKRGRVYSVSGASSSYEGWYDLSIQTSFSGHATRGDVDEIFSLIEKDFLEWLTPEKLVDLQENQKNVAVMNFETNHSKLMQTTTLGGLEGEPNVMSELEALMLVQYEELTEFAKGLFKLENRYSLLMNVELE